MEKVEERKENQASEEKLIDTKDSTVLQEREKQRERTDMPSKELPVNDADLPASSQIQQFDSQKQEYNSPINKDPEDPQEQEAEYFEPVSEIKKEISDHEDLGKSNSNDYKTQEILSAEEINEQIQMAEEDIQYETNKQKQNSNTDQDTLQELNQKLAEKTMIIEQQTQQINELKSMVSSSSYAATYKEPERNQYEDGFWGEVNIEDRFPDLDELWITKKIKQNLNKNTRKGFKANALTLKANVQSKLSSSSISIVPKPFIGN